ncbi:surface-adhesin E family protein, partial [Roseateles sp. GG27B]
VQPVPVAALSRWQFIVSGEDIQVYFDSQTYFRSASYVRVWLMWNATGPRESSVVYPSKIYRSEKTLKIYNCSEQSHKTLHILQYSEQDAAGQIVVDRSYEETAERFNAVVPETIGESIWIAVCAKPPGAR